MSLQDAVLRIADEMEKSIASATTIEGIPASTTLITYAFALRMAVESASSLVPVSDFVSEQNAQAQHREHIDRARKEFRNKKQETATGFAMTESDRWKLRW